MPGSYERLRSLLRELKRRKVYRVAVTYVVVAFAGLEAVDILVPATTLPPWTDTFFLALVVLGFPVAVVLAWAFEVTPAGIRRTGPAGTESGAERATGADPGEGKGRRRSLLVVSLLVLGVLGYAGWTVLGSIGDLPGGASGLRSIAVLPLDDLSPGGSEQYFADGMTEALIRRLSLIDDLKVISRTSAMRYRDADEPIPVIARELGVDALIEGSVLHGEGQVRITVQLIDGTTDEHLWSESYQRRLEDVLALQADVAEAIATEIQVELTGTERERLGDGGEVDTEAYRAYLRGRHLWNRHTEEGWREAIEHFEGAIAADSTYAPAYAGLADALNSLAFFGHVRPADAYDRAREAVERARELDPSLPDAHTTLARIRYVYDWEWEGAEEAFRRAIRLNSNDAGAHHAYAVFLARAGRFEEAGQALNRALELDPLAPRLNNNRGWIPFLARNHRTAIREYRRARDLNPLFAMTWRELGWVYAEVGENEEAIRAAERAVQLSRDDFTLASLGYVLGRSGEEGRAREVLGELEARAADRYLSPTNLALVQLGLDETERALG